MSERASQSRSHRHTCGTHFHTRLSSTCEWRASRSRSHRHTHGTCFPTQPSVRAKKAYETKKRQRYQERRTPGCWATGVACQCCSALSVPGSATPAAASAVGKMSMVETRVSVTRPASTTPGLERGAVQCQVSGGQFDFGSLSARAIYFLSCVEKGPRRCTPMGWCRQADKIKKISHVLLF